jgi:serine/threonine-protein kinase
MLDTWSDRFREIDALLDAALEVPADERVAFVERTCASDPELRRELLRLVELVDSTGEFLESPAIELAAAWFRDVEGDTTRPPRVERVGPFKLIREIGHGGMGAVFLGERDDGQFEQRVAIKLMRQASSDILVARFLEERRILALLEHPRIAHLVDGGITPDGTPWFAMEYIEGEPINRYCDAHALTAVQRLALFTAVCDAVEYAHQHLVVHRDLKPSNILVTPDGELKLLDFGIAKLLDPMLPADGPDVTLTGLRAMTPEYAAPEQVRGHAVSTATDVYALGVLLYTLLTGQRPYDIRDRSAAEVERIICVLEPPKPSTRAPLPRALRADLDVIVMQALRKEPRRRYASAAAMREDIQRLQNGLPIRAREDSAGYRLGKFVRRRAAPLAVAAFAVMLLTGGAFRERTLRSRAEEEGRKAEQTTDFMFGLFEASENGRSLSDTVTARDLLSRGVAQARADTRPEERAQMLDVLGRLETGIGNFADARPLLTEALALRRRLYGEDHPDVATSLGDLADVVAATGDMTGAVALRREQLAVRRRVSGDNDVRTTDALYALAEDLHASGKPREAAPLLAEWEATVAKAPPVLTRTRLRQLNLLSAAVLYSGQAQRAESLGRAELTLARQLYGEHNDDVATALMNVGDALGQEGKRDQAEPFLHQAVDMMRIAYPSGHPRLATTLKLWAITLERLLRFQEAEAPLREALAMARRSLGDNNSEVVGIEQELAFTMTMTGRYDEALALSRQALDVVTKKFGAQTSLAMHARVFVADAMRGQGKFSEAEPILLAANERFKNSTGLGKTYWRSTIAALSRLYDAEGKPDSAAKYRALLSSP